uniref:Uncharacterized protein n=1 Tax=Aegilops tauschii TaxID=37682 RepID=M8CE56_AEGTA
MHLAVGGTELVEWVGAPDDANVGHVAVRFERLPQRLLPQARAWPCPAQQPGEVPHAPYLNHLEFAPGNHVGGHVLFEEALRHYPRSARQRHLPLRRQPQVVVHLRVEPLHVELWQDGAGHEVSVPWPEPDEGDERHDPDAGVGALAEYPYKGEEAEQHQRPEQAAALEGDEHEVGEDAGGPQEPAVEVAHHRPISSGRHGALGAGDGFGGWLGAAGGVTTVLEGIAAELPGRAVQVDEPVDGYLGENGVEDHLLFPMSAPHGHCICASFTNLPF